MRQISYALKNARCDPSKALEALKLIRVKYSDIIQYSPEAKERYAFTNQPENKILRLEAEAWIYLSSGVSEKSVRAMYEAAKARVEGERYEEYNQLLTIIQNPHDSVVKKAALQKLQERFPEVDEYDTYKDSEQ